MNNRIYAEARMKTFDSFRKLGMAATFVGLIDGKVKCNFLTPNQLYDLLQLYDNIADIPFEYTIYDEDGNKLTK